MSPHSERHVGRIVSFFVRLGALLVLWWALARGDRSSLSVGVPVALVAAATSLALAPHRRTGFRLTRVPGYAVFFMARSIVGGLDVARRALDPALPMKPGLVAYRMRITGDAARLVFVDTISLLPGTLTARIRDDVLDVHTLDRKGSVSEDLRDLERHVAALFGQDLGHSGEETL